MGKSAEWEEILENVVLFFEFGARLFFLENEDSVEMVSSFLRRENDVFSDSLFLGKCAEWGKDISEKEAWGKTLWTDSESFSPMVEDVSVEKKFEKESFIILGEESFPYDIFDEKILRKIKEYGEDFGNFASVEESFLKDAEKENVLFYKPGATEENVTVDSGKKRSILEFYEEGQGSEVKEIKVEVIREDKGKIDYDADIIAEMVGQKLYEIMNKSAEGFYL